MFGFQCTQCLPPSSSWKLVVNFCILGICPMIYRIADLNHSLELFDYPNRSHLYIFPSVSVERIRNDVNQESTIVCRLFHYQNLIIGMFMALILLYSITKLRSNCIVWKNVTFLKVIRVCKHLMD